MLFYIDLTYCTYTIVLTLMLVGAKADRRHPVWFSRNKHKIKPWYDDKPNNFENEQKFFFKQLIDGIGNHYSDFLFLHVQSNAIYMEKLLSSLLYSSYIISGAYCDSW